MRTKGAVSNGTVKLSELNTKFATNPDTMIVVSRKFAKLNGLTVTPVVSAVKVVEAVPAAVEATADASKVEAPVATQPVETKPVAEIPIQEAV